MRKSLAALAFVPLAACVAAVGERSQEEPLSVCPAAATVTGLDTSSWQGAIDWPAVKQSGRAFAIARVSDGLDFPDARFAGDWPAIKNAGMIRGAYQYFRASQDPIAQADLVVARLGALGAGDLPAILDLETSDGEPAAVVVARAEQWLASVGARTGKQPMVYTAAFMSSVIGTALAAYPLWVANYGVTCPRLPSGWTAWRIWQNGDQGSVPGVAGGVDTDLFNGTLAELAAFAGAIDWPCAASAYRGAQYWTCSGGNLFQCAGGAPVERACDRGCATRALGQDDLCVSGAAGWSCASSAYAGAQYWTCSGGALYRCDGGAGETVACPNGCVSHALGSDDACK